MKTKDVLKDEFIGEQVRIESEKNKTLDGMSGKIIDETKNTFKLMTEDGTKMVLKDQVSLIVEREGKRLRIEGKRLCFRPEERVKKIR
jgi:ribonuclease P protein subunit POP4